MNPSDQELLVACARGDETAWEALVVRYQRLIYAIPKRAGLHEDQAAEVFQEVFTTLLQKLNDIQQPEKLHAWLVTTARRKTWKLLSRERALQPANARLDLNNSGQELELIPDEAPLPDETLLRLEEQHRVRLALASLDERCRKLLKMLFYEPESPSYAEIAAQLGITVGSIGPTRARCLEKMLALLDK